MMSVMRKAPVVVILGATGTGKSKLAIELGRRFNGEIISADSMQMYKRLDIITNKVTAKEQAECPHHLLSVLSPLSTNNTVLEFRNMALPIVEKLLHENKLPIIVGGTNYYIEALLWDFLIDKQTIEMVQQESPASGKEKEVCTQTCPVTIVPQTSDSVATNSSEVNITALNNNSPSDIETKQSESDAHFNHNIDLTTSLSDCAAEDCNNLKAESGEAEKISKARKEKEGKYAGIASSYLHSLLQKVDPESAKQLHPENRRKIIRALTVYENHGIPMSQIHRVQHYSGNTPGLSGALRFPHCCIFWLQSELAVLDQRLDMRVDEMLRNGLISELHQLHQLYLESVAAQMGQPDYTLGIFQSIGFKEFHEYLILSADKRETPEGKALFQKGVESLKIATRQYARKQIRWIRNRFLNRPGVNVPAVYGLDSTDPSQWLHTVLQPAVDILSAVLCGNPVPVPPLVPDAKPIPVYVHNVCSVCDDQVFTTEQDWKNHLVSKRHKTKLKNKQRRENFMLRKETEQILQE